MKIGLYSELARQPHIKVRNDINEQGIEPIDIKMKLFRDKIIKSKEEHLKIIRERLDFFSLSSLRDLLFYVQEQRFTIPQIKKCLNDLGLKFCGFETKEIFLNTDDTYDLDKWQAYEEANPRAFSGMYQFWCQKVD